MAMGLHRREGDAVEPDAEEFFSVNLQGWAFLLELAKKYGWDPAGIQRSDRDDWSGEYYSNVGRYVTRADAATLAAALERSRGGQHYYQDSPGLVDEFIAYCKGGGFEIW